MHGKILLTETSIALTNDQECLTLESVHMERIERFVVFMYNKTCACSYVNDASYNSFFTGSRSLENIPATPVIITTLDQCLLGWMGRHIIKVA